MRKSFATGIGFGLTSGVITTLGLLVGLYSGSASVSSVISGIVVMAVADSLSDAMGMHLSAESRTESTEKSIWETTFSAFGAKFFTAMSFVVPLILLSIDLAVTICLLWGLFLVVFFSALIAKKRGDPVFRSILKHLFITIIVVMISHFAGKGVSDIIN